MTIKYVIVDIETCPINLELYKTLNEEEHRKLINPIDSKVICIGLRYLEKNEIFFSENEKEILENFWSEWSKIKKLNPNAQMCGFNILNFDIPFLVSRSLINNVVITSQFLLKSIIDLREKINAYRYGETRGRLKEYALLLGLNIEDINGSQIADLCIDKNWDKIKKYLDNDLIITDELYKRARDTKILEINKW